MMFIAGLFEILRALLPQFDEAVHEADERYAHDRMRHKEAMLCRRRV